MSDQDIRKLYGEMLRGGKHTKPKQISDMYVSILETDVQSELLPMRGESEPRVTKGEIKRQAKLYKQTYDDDRSITAIVQAMVDGEIPITPPPQEQENDTRTRQLLTDDEISNFNDVISVSDQIKIKNILNTSAKKALHKLLSSGYAPPKKIDGVMSMIMYSEIEVGDFMEMIQTAQNDPKIQLLDADFLISAAPGVYSIDNFVIQDGVRDSNGVSRNYRELTVRSLEALKPLGSGGVQAGPYESALQLLSNGAISQKGKGDIAVGSELMELKAEQGRVGPEEYPSRMEIVNKAVESFNKAVDRHLSIYNDSERSRIKKEIGNKLKDKGTSYDVMSNLISSTFGQYETSDVRYDIVHPVAKLLYRSKPQVEKIVQTFANNYGDFRPIIAEALFDMYKNEKTGTSGAWNRLIGLNLESSDVICIFETGDQFADAVRDGSISSNIPNLIATGPSANRDYMWQLLPN